MNYNFECKLKVITPLFMGGANQQPELRTQTINGLLRWWFRVAGGSFEDEKRIFGWAGETSNQGLVRIHLNVPDLSPSDFSSTGLSGYEYLGFSLRRTRRKAIPENTEFKVRILLHPKSTEGDIKKFFCALWLAFNLGNFGSRARRGFGSIKIEDITNDCFGLNFVPSEDLKNWVKTNLDRIKTILNPSPRSDIPYIFDNFEIYLFGKNNDWKNLLNEAGITYRNFRRKEKLDDRVILGLPIVSDRRYRYLRRASPLIFKVIEINNHINNYALLFIVIKPKDNDKKDSDKNEFIFHPEIKNVKWNLLSNFVNGKTKIYPLGGLTHD